jgi:hypothetical protein
MGSTGTGPQFERWVGQTSNQDRCTRCGRPRSAHGPDWSCPSGRPRGAALAAVIAGSLLAVAGVVLRLTAAIASYQVPAALLSAGVIVAVAGLSMLGPRSKR